LAIRRRAGIYSDIRLSVKAAHLNTPDIATDTVDEATRQWAERHPGADRFGALVSLIRAYGLVARSIEGILRPLGLNLSRYEVLLLLSFTRAGMLPTMRLRDLLIVHGSSVTYLVDRLEAAGLVERRPSDRDGRVSLVCITDAGRRLVEEASTELVDAGFGPIGILEDEDRQGLVGVLRALRLAATRPV
jgi:DNA-binding MarR family transcriptional regulator